MPKVDLFIVAGEASGDLQGSKLIEELLQLRPSIPIGAVAGPRMRAFPIQSYFPMENLQVMGFIDVLAALPKIVRQFFAIRKKILELNPKAVVFIDYPGFNLRLERSLRKKGYKGKLIHYVCPTVWAWGKKRIPLMAENLDLLLTLFPFEKGCFSHTKLPVKYVGHPLAHSIGVPPVRKESKIIAIFPGSREKEIERNFPLQLEIAQKLVSLNPQLQIAISISHADREAQVRSLSQHIDAIYSSSEENYSLMKSCHLALATSGTVTLELALHGVPTVVNFAIKKIDCWIAQKIFKINLPFYCLANIVVSKEVFPELFGPNLTKEKFFFWAQKLCFDSEARNLCMERCLEVRKSLGTKPASREAAREVIDSLDF